MLIQPDLIVRDVLVDLFQGVHDDPDRLTEVFGDRPAAERDEILTFFRDRVIPVDLGFKREQPAVPGAFVTLGASQEGVPPLGELVGTDNPGGTALSEPFEEHTGTAMRSSVRVGLLAENANLAVWLGNVVLWGLLQARRLMTEKGLLEQQLGAQDLVFDQDFSPAYVFRRDVVLQTVHLMTVLTVIPKLRGVTVAATAFDDPTVYRAVLRR